MVHIVKSKKTGQFYVIVTGNNNEVLSTSELLKTKQSAFKNIRAQGKQFEIGEASIQVQDNTAKKPVVYGVTKNNKWINPMLLEKAPIPSHDGNSTSTKPPKKK